jgi:[CysO sulfur-carrier protein]-S-L-cysteine hydrolase
MTVLLPAGVAERMRAALAAGGQKEIGGILMGEHVNDETFRICDITVQYKGGTFARFVRLVEYIVGPLRDFFSATNHDYTRFNYMGEWHSHHSFALRPSGTDESTMMNILTDPNLGARFVILLLVKLETANDLQCAVTVYQPRRAGYLAEVRFE